MLLFILVLLAIAGVLGAVLKAFALLVMVGIVAAITLAVIAWYALRHQLRKLDRELDRRATRIQVGQPRPNEQLPPSRDDRY